MKGRRIDWKKSGIYSIICAINGKQYIGCSSNIYSRINNHKSILNKKNVKRDNSYLIDDWHKYGADNFDYIVLEYTTENLKDKECYYIELFDTINRDKGYNLRRDNSKKGMIPLEETKKKYSEAQIKRFSNINERIKIGKMSSKFWKENPEKKNIMADKVSKSLTKYTIKQFTKDGKLVREWNRVKDIIKENPTYKVHNIYAVCSGEKPSMYGYVWTKCQIKIQSE